MNSPLTVDIGSEGGVLGSMILDRETIPVVRGVIGDQFFFSKVEHQILYGAICEIHETYNADAQWDLVLLRSELRMKGKLDAVGGVEYLVRICESLPTTANAEYYAKCVRAAYRRKQIADMGASIGNCATEPSNLREIVNTALSDLQAECIAVPPFGAEYLQRGHALHFRCRHREARGMRIDVMSVLRGVAPFEALWRRRTTVEAEEEMGIELLALPDLVQAKKTQRDKDWPMIRRLDALRTMLDGDAVKEMDLLLGRLSGLRAQWGKERPVYEKDGLAVFLAPNKPVFAADVPLSFDVTFRNVSSKDFTLLTAPTLLDRWDLQISGAQGDKRYRVVRVAIDRLDKIPGPLVLKAGESSQFQLGVGYYHACLLVGEEPSVTTTLTHLPPGSYTLVASHTCHRATKNVEIAKLPPLWVGEILARPVSFESADKTAVSSVQDRTDATTGQVAAIDGKDERPAEGKMKTSLKGWELYIWQDHGNIYSSLLVGTNRLKTDEEISQAAVKGLDAIKPRLDELKGDQYVSVLGRNRNERAPEDQAKVITEYCRKIGLETLP